MAAEEHAAAKYTEASAGQERAAAVRLGLGRIIALHCGASTYEEIISR